MTGNHVCGRGREVYGQDFRGLRIFGGRVSLSPIFQSAPGRICRSICLQRVVSCAGGSTHVSFNVNDTIEKET
jgi:hypothetical protein